MIYFSSKSSNLSVFEDPLLWSTVSHTFLVCLYFHHPQIPLVSMYSSILLIIKLKDLHDQFLTVFNSLISNIINNNIFVWLFKASVYLDQDFLYLIESFYIWIFEFITHFKNILLMLISFILLLIPWYGNNCFCFA